MPASMSTEQPIAQPTSTRATCTTATDPPNRPETGTEAADASAQPAPPSSASNTATDQQQPPVETERAHGASTSAAEEVAAATHTNAVAEAVTVAEAVAA